MPKKILKEEYSKIFIRKYPTLELLSEYNGDKNYITVKCKIHEYIFNTKPNWLKQGKGCKKCYNEKRSKNKKLTTEDFIKRAKEIHGDKYDYSKVEYNGNKIKICIICPIHGEFWQTPYIHLNGGGCQCCNESHLERDVRLFLQKSNINYEYQKRFNWLGRQTLDFYLPDYNIAIECQGLQHFTEVDHFGGYVGFRKILRRDNIKNIKCIKNNVKLIYIVADIKQINIRGKVLNRLYNELYEIKDFSEKINKITNILQS